MVPERFEPAINKIKGLEKFKEYLGAFVFGSVARDDATKESDLDIKVIIGKKSKCWNINHPLINGVKLDLTFISKKRLFELIEDERKTGRIPMIAESIIVFDKTGFLKKTKDSLRGLKPQIFLPQDYKLQQFFVYHTDEKVRRDLKKDQDSATLSMMLGLGELIKIHYRFNGKWKVSSKRMLKDLDAWDKKFARYCGNLLKNQVWREDFLLGKRLLNMRKMKLEKALK